jgi:dipeptidyl aminopeptidase/acylaminoacyl peptidase
MFRIRSVFRPLPFLLAALCCVAPAAGQERSGSELDTLRRQVGSLSFQFDILNRKLDQLQLAQGLAEAATVEFFRLTGPPRGREPNPTAQGAGNPLIIYTHVIIPRQLDRSRRHPLILFPHGGVHGYLTASYIHILRELIAEGYVVAAPEYRGSAGFGRTFQQSIDYGGLEIEDTEAVRRFMLETFPFLDPARVGIVGWSHGGLHALMSIFNYPEVYAAAYAGVPVSDLVARMGYKGDEYRSLFSAEYHIGKTAEENVAEYRRRSPAWNAGKYQGTPLLIHGNTNDEDVNVLEVERLIEALKATGKSGFQYRIYQDAPGGHQFNRLDTPEARQSRREIWEFLAAHLKR